MLSYSQIMSLMKRYNDLKTKIEDKDSPLDSNDEDVQEFNKIVQILTIVQKQIGGECQGRCCGHHH